MSAFLRCITFSGVVSLLLLSFVAFFVFPRPEFVVPTLIRVAGSARRCFSLAEVDETLQCVTEVLAGPWEVRGWDPPAKPRSSTGQKLQETNLEKGDLHDPSSLRQSISLRWQAPFFSGGGYCSEAISYVEELSKHLFVAIAQHGDSFNPAFVRGLPPGVSELLGAAMRSNPPRGIPLVEICHSEPGAWSLPHPRYHTSPCPSGDAAFAVGRTMFETDRLPEGWAERLNQMDQIWVPTSFARAVFTAGGVAPERLRVVPEAVDTHLFDPARHEPLPEMARDVRFKFLSVFKWEERKGWDVLLRAFLAEFPTPTSGAALYIRTTAYHTDSAFEERVAAFARGALALPEDTPLSHIVILKDELPLSELPRLYAGADCFVLPSRGEGWGRPHIEAMAMGLPAIATNWSGNTEFMTEENSFLIPITGLLPVREGAFKGHLWADPSVDGLRRLMRAVFSDPSGARVVGKRGEVWVRERYNPEAVGQRVLAELRSIAEEIKTRSRGTEL